MGTQKEALEELRRQFQTADLNTMLNSAEEAALLHARFQHYTSLDNLLKMIEKKEMWLTRSDSLTLDDWNECWKYGKSSFHRQSYIGCFSHHGGESAAMWGLYCSPNARQIKFSVPSDVVDRWLGTLRSAQVKAYAAESILGKEIDAAHELAVDRIEFADILYPSVKGDAKNEKSRDGLIRWGGVKSQKRFTPRELSDSRCTSRMKDVEWDFEEETRLIVRIKSQKECSGVRRIRVSLTDELIARMAFTLSPWMADSEAHDYKAMIRVAVHESVDPKWLTKRQPYVYKSTLCGALGRWAKDRNMK